MEKMARTARQTDRAIENLGDRLDRIGTREQVQQMNRQAGAMQNLDRGGRQVNQTLTRTDRDMDRVRRRSDTLGASIRKLGATLFGLSRIFGLLKWPVIAAGIGMVVQAVGALAGGIIALLPRIADLTGALAPAIAGITGLGLAMGTVKLAFADFGKAMGGNEEALKKMTPAARRLIATLKLYKPVIDDLRKSAQAGLFPGIDTAIRRLQRGVPTLERLLTRMGNTLGGLATLGARRMTTRGFLADFERLGGQGVRIIDRLGKALLNIVDALRHVGVAAIPFTDWLSKTVLGWTKFWNESARAGREGGRLQQFFRRTRSSMEMFGRIIKNLWDVLVGLGRAARPLGDALWASFEKATKGWADFVKSFEGRYSLTRQFLSMQGAIEEIAGLVMDVVKAIFRMGSDQGVEGVVKSLRDIVPVLERILTAITAAFGPPMIEALEAIARLLENLTGATGPMTAFLKAITGVADAVSYLMEKIPILGTLIATAFGVMAVNRFIGALGRVAAAMLGVQGAAALGLGGAGLGGAAAAGAGAARGGGLTARALAGGGAAAAGGGSRLARLAGRAGPVARVAGKAAWPVAAILAAVDAFTAPREGGIGMQGAQTVSAMLSGASFGALPRLKTPSEKLSEQARLRLYGGTADVEGGWLGKAAARVTGAFTGAGRGGRGPGVGGRTYTGLVPGFEEAVGRRGGDAPKTMRDVNAQIRLYVAHLEDVKALNAPKETQAYMDALELNLRALRNVKGQEDAMRTARERAKAPQAVAGLMGAYGIRRRGGASPEEAQQALVGGATARLQRMTTRGGRQAFAQEFIRNVNRTFGAGSDAAKKMTEDVFNSLKKLNRNVVLINGRIYRNSQAAWRNIKSALTMPMEQARQANQEAFTKMQQAAVGALQGMGYTRAQARGFISDMEASGDRPGSVRLGEQQQYGETAQSGGGLARGGRVRGFGLQDKVPIAAPGELVVNRHQERIVNRVLGRFGTQLGGDRFAGAQAALGRAGARRAGGRRGDGQRRHGLLTRARDGAESDGERDAPGDPRHVGRADDWRAGGAARAEGRVGGAAVSERAARARDRGRHFAGRGGVRRRGRDVRAELPALASRAHARAVAHRAFRRARRRRGRRHGRHGHRDPAHRRATHVPARHPRRARDRQQPACRGGHDAGDQRASGRGGRRRHGGRRRRQPGARPSDDARVRLGAGAVARAPVALAGRVRLEHQGRQPDLVGVRHPAGASRQQDGVGRGGLDDEPGHPDQVGAELHSLPVRLPVGGARRLAGPFAALVRRRRTDARVRRLVRTRWRLQGQSADDDRRRGRRPERVRITRGGGGGGDVRVVIQNMTITNNRPGDIRRQVRGEIAAAIRGAANDLRSQPLTSEEGVLS